jgi:hypothetical protein
MEVKERIDEKRRKRRVKTFECVGKRDSILFCDWPDSNTIKQTSRTNAMK